MFKFVVTKNVKELFHRAVIQNDVARVKLLLEQASQDPKFHVDTLNDEGLTALQLSCFAGNIELVRLLVEHGANVRIKDCHGWTLLHGAALGGKLDISRFLIEKGCRCSSRNDNGEQPIDLASDLAMIVLLLKTMLEQGQNLAVEKYMLRHPKLKNELAREIEMAVELDHHQEHLRETHQQADDRTDHNRKLPASKSAGHLIINGARLKIENDFGTKGLKKKDKSSRPKLVRSTSTGDLSKTNDFHKEIVGRDSELTKREEKLSRISGTSYSYNHYTSDSDKYYARHKSNDKEKNGRVRLDAKIENAGSRYRKKSDSAVKERPLTRKESDISSVSSRSETSDSSRLKRSNPSYASVDSTSRRSRSGDSDSSSQSDTGVNRQRRKNKQRTIYENGIKPLPIVPISESYETASNAKHDNGRYSKYQEGRDARFKNGRTGNTSPQDDDRKASVASTASEHSSNFDTQDRAEVETEALYENIPNDVLLSIILANRLSEDVARHQSVSSNVEMPPIEALDSEVFSDDTNKPLYNNYDKPILYQSEIDEENVRQEPVYENLKHFDVRNSDRTFSDNVRSGHSVDDYAGSNEVNNVIYAEPIPQRLDVDYENESVDRDNDLVAVPEDFADYDPSSDNMESERTKDTSPVYENLPCLTKDTSEAKDTNDNHVLHKHIFKQLSRRGVHSVSAGSLPNSYYSKEEQMPVKFHDDTHIGNSSENYPVETEQESGSSFRVFQLVKVEYPEVFV